MFKVYYKKYGTIGNVYVESLSELKTLQIFTKHILAINKLKQTLDKHI